MSELLDNKHQFAFHFLNMHLLQKKHIELVLDDKEIVHRIFKVVKLAIGENFVLFNQQAHALLQLVSSEKKSLTVSVLSYETNKQLNPHIVFMLPLLKRDALESSIYSLAELGVNEIQLIVTEKSRKKLTEKEMLRIEKIVISAAEQSKHYAYPIVHEPKVMKAAVTCLPQDIKKVLFDVAGESFFKQDTRSFKKLALVIGPEGGLTHQETSLLSRYKFQAIRLTETVLRALQAVAISAALFRL